MVLAEVIASAMAEMAAAVAADVAHVRSHHLKGRMLADGIALGHAVLHQPRIVVTNLIAEDVPAEKRRLERAMGSLLEQCRYPDR